MLAFLPFLSPAFADDTPVLVSALQARNAEATGLAALIENFLAQELGKNPDLAVLRVEDTPAFDQYSARVWMEGCPPGEIVGCTLVLGQRAGATFAVTGTVQSLVEGTRVGIDILDIEGSRSVLSFQSELRGGSDEAFAEGVAKVLVAAIRGELGERDIREGEAETSMDREVLARQLEDLSRELGEVTVEVSRRVIKRPAYTTEDLARSMRAEGGNPWERLGMSPGEYLRYKNSGRSLMDWRERAMGRAGQALIRPWAGYLGGPWDGVFYGRYAYDAVGGSLQVVDAYSTQVVQEGGGGGVGISAGYGLFPALDVGGVLGVVTGAYSFDVAQETVGQTQGVREPVVRGNTTFFLGPRLTVALLPVRAIRPVFGGGILFARTTGAGELQEIPTELASWPGAWQVSAEGFVGGEAQISKKLDFYVHLPLSFRFAGETSQASRTGFDDVVDVVEPAPAGAIGGGVQIGIQVRLGGTRPRETSRLEEVEPDQEN